MLSAMSSASEEISRAEKWVPARAGVMSSSMSRIMSIALASVNIIPAERSARGVIRQNLLKVIAYLPADLRLRVMIDLAKRNPEALDDLFSGRVDEKFEVYRYNLLSSLGVFARHGLVEEVFTRERIGLVGGVLRQVKTSEKSGERGKS